MRNLILITLFSFFMQCQSQKTHKIMIPKVDNNFEKFDVGTFDKTSTRGSRILKNENNVILEDRQSYGFIKQIYLRDIFCYNYLFYKSGNIKEKGVTFNEGSPVGIWYYFDESGKFIKEENTDEGYDFMPSDIIQYCESHKINLPKGYHDSGFQTKVMKQEQEGKKVWNIRHQIAGDKIEEIILDGKTGKELNKKIIPFHNS